jgi:hypothetical protein
MSQDIHAQLMAAGADASLIDQLKALGLSLEKVLELIATYGPVVLAVLTQLLSALPKSK